MSNLKSNSAGNKRRRVAGNTRQRPTDGPKTGSSKIKDSLTGNESRPSVASSKTPSANLKYSLVGNDHLPPVIGPKLQPFEHRRERVEFLSLLSQPESELSGGHSGGHAHVFKVNIRGEQYALKVFKFFDVKEARADILPFSNHEIDNNTLTFHCDPFFAECRAYGRIQEIQEMRQRKSKRKVPDIAVPCYGFLGLSTPVYEELFSEKFAVTDWNRRESDYHRPSRQREPFRALVKELVENQDAIVDPKNMKRDLKILRGGGLYQRDVAERNYLGGLLVDFSVAWTSPHWASQVLPQPLLESYQDGELWEFDEMMKEANVKTTVRAARDTETLGKLRARPSKKRNH